MRFNCSATPRNVRPHARIHATARAPLLVVVRHFPIIDAHPVAMSAAEAVEAAGSQGRFWDMYWRIYRSRHPPTTVNLHRYAGALGLDVARFEKDMRDHEHAGRIREDFETGLQSGVNATPTIFVNGFRHDDEHTYGSLLAALKKPDPF